ncbi:MAG: hypothetical protein AAF478_08470 [Pseudomonadota bacterium]
MKKYNRRPSDRVKNHNSSRPDVDRSVRTSDHFAVFMICFLGILIGANLTTHSDFHGSVIELITCIPGLSQVMSVDWGIRDTIAAAAASGTPSAPGADFSMPVRSMIVAFHQASLVLGLGGVVFLDLYMTRFLFSCTICVKTIDVLKFGARLVELGLYAVWLSGILILAYYYMAEPELLMNPKIWGKLFIVVVLTVNGFMIHQHVLPKLESLEGGRILDVDFATVAMNFIPFAVISMVGWGFAFFLGAFKELNNVVSSGTIILSFLLTALVVYIFALFLCSILTDRCAQQEGSEQNQQPTLS